MALLVARVSILRRLSRRRGYPSSILPSFDSPLASGRAGSTRSRRFSGARARATWSSMLLRGQEEVDSDAWKEKLQGLKTNDKGRLDLVIFISTSSVLSARFSEKLEESLRPGVVLGVTTPGGVIADGVEVESDDPVVAILGASLPGVVLAPFFSKTSSLPQLQLPRRDEDDSVQGEHIAIEDRPDLWRALVSLPETEAPSAVVFASEKPRAFNFSNNPDEEGFFTVEEFLKHLDNVLPFSRIIGGMVPQNDTTEFYLNGERRGSEGALGLVLFGEYKMNPMVSQGPMGRPLTITSARGNVVYGLNGKPLREALSEWFQELDATERAHFSDVILAGFRLPSSTSTGELGVTGPKGSNTDYIIRHGGLLKDWVQGKEVSALVIAMPSGDINEGQTIQFHYRTSLSSSLEFRTLLEKHKQSEGKGGGYEPTEGQEESAVFIFSCVGRGKSFYGLPNHESGILEETLGKRPSIGLFCSGEIGPCGPRTFVHGYTTTLALFQPLCDKDITPTPRS